MEPGMEKRLEQSPLDKRRLADAGAEPSLVSSGGKANSRLSSLLHCGRTLSALYRQGWQGDLYGSGHASPLGTIWLYGLTMFLPWTLLLPLLRMKKLLRYLKNCLSGRKFLPVALGAQPPALLHSGPQYPSGLCAPRHPGLVHPDRTGALAMEQPPPGNQTSYLPPSLHIWHHGHFPAGARIRPT